MERCRCDFGSNVRFDFYFLCGQVKARSAVNAVGIEQRYGGQLELRTRGY